MVWLCIFTVSGSIPCSQACHGCSTFFKSRKIRGKILSWETISDRADYLSLCIFHKIGLHETRPLIRSCMPQLHNKVVNTRSSNKYVEFKYKNEVFNKSFFPFVTKIYNSLDLSLRNLPNLDEFKVNLKLKYKKKKIKHFQGVFQSIPMLCTRNCVWVNQT